jgi:acetylornithine/N-succinyldiaminopimelate aminotransferase
MAKGMGNGFPVGGIIIAPHIKPKHLMLGTTFGGNHLACAAAIAVLEVIRDADLMKNAAEKGELLKNILLQFPQIHNVRGKGLMIGFDVDDSIKNLRKDLLSKHHIFTGEAKPAVIRLLPSLALGQTEIEEFHQAISTEIHSLELTTSH